MGIVIAVIVILFVILAVVASLIVANLGDPTFKTTSSRVGMRIPLL